MINEIRLSELVALKLSHDLAGPIGALNNGIELLADNDSDYFKDSFDLVQTTSKDAISKLLFYRQAYGLSDKAISHSTAEILELTQSLINEKKIKLIYDKKQDALNISSYLFKIILNIIILFEKYLILGGNLELNFIDEKKAQIIANGDNIKFQQDHFDIINSYDGNTDIEISATNAYLVHCLIKESKANANINFNENKVRFSIG